MRYARLLLCMAAISLSASAMAVEFRTLIMQAVKANDGKASGELTGAVADTIRAQIARPDARVMAEVSTLEKLPQAGCKRLKIRFTTPGTLLATKEGTDQMLDTFMEMNVCPNGQPPAETPEKPAS